MESKSISNIRLLTTESIGQLAEIRQLLSACGLPISDLSLSKSVLFLGSCSETRLVGVIGLEVFDSVALLRSLAVAPSHRHHGLGRSLVAFAEAHAACLGIESFFLLTTTAEAFFTKLGYSPASREDAPSPIQATAQFSGLCPASSAFMYKRLRD